MFVSDLIMKVRVLLVLGWFVFGILTINWKDSLRLGSLSRVGN